MTTFTSQSEELDALAAVDAIDGASTTHNECLSEAVRSIPQLIALKRLSHDLTRFKEKVQALPKLETATLILRLSTAEDPLFAWSIHLVLDRRGIPPALRWQVRDDSPQMEYVSYTADLFWFCTRQPNHTPNFRGWRGAFCNIPASSKWHSTIHRQYLWNTSRNSLSHLTAKGLRLEDSQRQELMTIKTSAMQSARRELGVIGMETTRHLLLSHAISKPDKSGLRCPSSVANRRVAIWRTYILSGRSVSLTATNWERLTGESISRQAIAKQVEIITEVLRAGR